jgi:hypothetical protein
MKTPKLTELQVKMMEEARLTRNFYAKDPSRRALMSNGSCSYENDEGNKCAIGRRLNKRDMEYLKENDMIEGYGITEIYGNLSTERIKALPEMFWEALQDFHDESQNWDAKGISTLGQNNYEFLIQRIKDHHFY